MIINKKILACGVSLFGILLLFTFYDGADDKSTTTKLIEQNNYEDESTFLGSVGLPVYKQRSSNVESEISTYRYSYYSSENGKYKTQPGFYEERKNFTIDNTAIMLIDPWKDMVFPELNYEISKHCAEYIVPIFTNNPDELYYNTKIQDSLLEYVNNDNVKLVYYSDNTLEDITEDMILIGKTNLVYMGYATEMCVLFRSIGIMSMNYSEYANQFDFYIVPEATLAMVSEREQDNVAMRNDICIMLAQEGLASIIVEEDLVNWLEDIR